MQAGKYNLVAHRPYQIVLTDKATFKKLVYRELFTTEFAIDRLKELVKNNKIVEPVAWQETADRLVVVMPSYDSSLEQLCQQKMKYDENELLNTLEQILILLRELKDAGLQYGMLQKYNICMFDGELKLMLGPVQSKKLESEGPYERDLRILGLIMLELTLRQKVSQDSIEYLLSRLDKQCGVKLSGCIRCLCDPNPSKRENVWKILTNCSQNSKHEIQNALSPKSSTSHLHGSPNDGRKKNNSLLAESNNSTPAVFDYSLEYFQNKIQRIDDLVNECLKRSRRLIQRSENRIK